MGRGEAAGTARHDLRLLQPLRLEPRRIGQHHALRYVQTRAAPLPRQGHSHPPRVQAQRELQLRARLHRRALRLHEDLRPYRPKRHRDAREVLALQQRPLRLPFGHEAGTGDDVGVEQLGDEGEERPRLYGRKEDKPHRRALRHALLQPRRKGTPVERPLHTPAPQAHAKIYVLALSIVCHLRL